MPLTSSPLLSSTPNFRDLGGYRAECGRSVRHGLIYRSQDFSNLSSEDMERLRDLGIVLVCDVRSDSERLQTPSQWPVEGELERLNLNISADLRASHEAITQLLSGAPNEEHARQAMLLTYRMFPDAFATKLAQLFDCILASEQLPLAFHCAAGKDRTGFIAAILLNALGVPRATILADYLLTAKRWKGPQSEAAIRRYLTPLCEKEPPTEVIRTLCGVSPDYLAAAFEIVDREYGGVADYLKLLGIHAETQHRLKDLLLA